MGDYSGGHWCCVVRDATVSLKAGVRRSMVSTHGNKCTALIHTYARVHGSSGQNACAHTRAKTHKYTRETRSPTLSRVGERLSGNNIVFHGDAWCGTERGIAEVGTDR